MIIRCPYCGSKNLSDFSFEKNGLCFPYHPILAILVSAPFLNLFCVEQNKEIKIECKTCNGVFKIQREHLLKSMIFSRN